MANHLRRDRQRAARQPMDPPNPLDRSNHRSCAGEGCCTSRGPPLRAREVKGAIELTATQKVCTQGVKISASQAVRCL